MKREQSDIRARRKKKITLFSSDDFISSLSWKEKNKDKNGRENKEKK